MVSALELVQTEFVPLTISWLPREDDWLASVAAGKTARPPLLTTNRLPAPASPRRKLALFVQSDPMSVTHATLLLELEATPSSAPALTATPPFLTSSLFAK